MEDLEKDHEHLLASEQGEIREEMDKFKNNILMEIVSTIYLILRTKEGRETWGILFAEIHITITKIMCKRLIFTFLKQQEFELAVAQLFLLLLLMS